MLGFSEDLSITCHLDEAYRSQNLVLVTFAISANAKLVSILSLDEYWRVQCHKTLGRNNTQC